jgi:hypothetical protein
MRPSPAGAISDRIGLRRAGTASSKPSGFAQGLYRHPERYMSRRAMREVYAARRFTLLSAMAVSFLSAAFSSSRFCWSKVAQSLRPSSFAQAISVP